jgi:hypothetical protein
MAKRKEHLPVRRVAGKARKPKPVMAWGGFVDGKLCEWLSGFYDVEHLSVFRTRRDARRCCEDVRRVEIRIVR